MICLISLLALPCKNAQASILSNIKNAVTSLKRSDDESENRFNFIKSNESSGDFFYDGSLLLYGGITLICISILGIILTLKPKKKKGNKKRRKHEKEEKQEIRKSKSRLAKRP